MEKRILGFNWFELGLILVVTLVSAAFLAQSAPAVLAEGELGTAGYAVLDFAAAFCGICSVVLCAKGKKSGFLFGLANVAGYAAISFNNGYYGEVMLNTLFYIPANVVSYIIWSRNKDHDRADREVKARALSIPQLAVALVIVAIATVGYHFVLEALGGQMTVLDGATTVMSVFATLLMVARYSEQWLLWIIIDAMTVALWCFAGDPVMVAMWGAYLVNAFYGYLMWLNKSGRNVPFKELLDKAADGTKVSAG